MGQDKQRVNTWLARVDLLRGDDGVSGAGGEWGERGNRGDAALNTARKRGGPRGVGLGGGKSQQDSLKVREAVGTSECKGKIK